jgi:hypothetical protein
LEDTSSAWMEWCKYEMPHWIGDKAVVFKVKPGAKILHLSTDKDYQQAINKYKGEYDSINNEYALDFAAIAKDFDAVHVAKHPRTISDALTYWDVESTVWFDPTQLEFVKLVDIEKQCAIPTGNETDFEKEYWNRRHTKYNLKLSRFFS